MWQQKQLINIVSDDEEPDRNFSENGGEAKQTSLEIEEEFKLSTPNLR